MSVTMTGPHSAGAALLLSIVLLAGCSNEDPQSVETTIGLDQLEVTMTTDGLTPNIPVIISELPPVARASDDGGEPRSAAYWALWNTCAPDNRSEQAAANGGREAGWVLVDDLLADPGIGVGDHLVTTCPEGLALLEAAISREESLTAVVALAGQLLAAELNRAVGAENCPAAEESVVAAQVVLATAEFDGITTATFDTEAAGIVPDLIELLAAYNAGDLCR